MAEKPVVYFVFDVTSTTGTRGVRRPIAIAFNEYDAFEEVLRRRKSLPDYDKYLVMYERADITVGIL